MKDNEIILRSHNRNNELPIRLLLLEEILSPGLLPLTPRGNELFLTEGDRDDALIAYAERIRKTYRANEHGFRDELLKLAETIIQGQSIIVSCSCRKGTICHADVVELALKRLIAVVESETQS